MAEKNRILEIALGGLYLLSGITKLLPIPAIVETFDEFAQHFPFRLKPPGWLFLRRLTFEFVCFLEFIIVQNVF